MIIDRRLKVPSEIDVGSSIVTENCWRQMCSQSMNRMGNATDLKMAIPGWK